jgi:hypothetical protein
MAAMKMTRILLTVLIGNDEAQVNYNDLLHHGHAGAITIPDQNNESRDTFAFA